MIQSRLPLYRKIRASQAFKKNLKNLDFLTESAEKQGRSIGETMAN
jgi:hypothetical protein